MAQVVGEKRPRGEMNGAYPAESYQKGSIMRVEVENFMTYGHCIFEPGPRLNLVLGPNGTGKSSLVCALCVGLGGASKLLGRQTEIGDFIKRGEDKGFTKITLCSGDPEKPTVVTRHLSKRVLGGGTHSSWEINGLASNKKEVEEVCSEFNVQLDNLCQFLPQDRVQAFAAMGKKELLVETEKALESSDLHRLHEELIKSRDELRGLQTTVAARNKKIQTLEALNEDLERDVRRIQERQAILEEVSFMEKRVPWVRYIQESAKFEKAKRMVEQAKGKKEALEAEFNVSRGPIDTKAKAKAAAVAELKRVKTVLITRDKQKVALDEQLGAVDDNMEGAIGKLGDAKKASAQRAKDMANLAAAIEAGTAELASLPPPPDHSARIAEITAALRPLKDRHISLRGDMDDVSRDAANMRKEMTASEARLQELAGARGQRLQALQRSNRNIIEIDRYVQEKKIEQAFRKPVYGPILCEVNVGDQVHAGFLEQHVENRLWETYLTQTAEDQMLLQDHSARHRLGMNVINYTGDPERPVAHPKGDAARYASIGVTHTLDQVFEAPPAVKHALCDLSRLNVAYVGTMRTENLVNKEKGSKDKASMLDSMQMDMLWTPKNQYSRSHSRYSKDVTTRVVQARPARLFTGGGGGGEDGRASIQAEIAALRLRINDAEAEVARIGELMDEVQRSISILEDERKQLSEAGQDRSNKANKLSLDLKHRRSKLQKLQARPDPASGIPQLESEIARFTAKRRELVVSLVGALEAIVELVPAMTAATLSSKQLADQLKRMEERYRERTQQVRHAVEMYEQCRQIYRENKSALAEAKRLAFESFDRDAADAALRDEFDKLPQEMDELMDMITERKMDAERVVCSNENALKQYEERGEEISRLKSALATETDSLRAGQEAIEERKNQWLPSLRNLVDKVSENFQHKFAAIGCTGEVMLEETGEEYKDYAIRLLVSFRDGEKLQELTATRQSGGERSVSTILYLISLQDVTVCPFRVVDEINQGMDPINERKVFQQLVRSACKSNTPQCFLLTPKLLPELSYSPEVTILNIFNGPWIKDVSNVWSQEMLFRKRTRAVPG